MIAMSMRDHDAIEFVGMTVLTQRDW